MCDPVSIGLMAVSAATSLYGTMQQSRAASQAQQAIANQNRATQAAQSQAFAQRMQAGIQQTAGQTSAMRESLAARDAVATQMRDAQMAAVHRQGDILGAENTQAEALRATGDRASQDLLTQSSADAQLAAQSQREAQAQALLEQSQGQQPTGPETTDPNGSGAVAQDPVTQAALARRTAQAATNIRDYGAKIARVGSYSAPGDQVATAIAANRAGIMPAAFADKLLRAGSDIRLAPDRQAFQNAASMGQAEDTVMQLRGQNALDAASLSYGNAVDIANLTQNDATTIAANKAAQDKANAEAAASQGRIISSVGNLAAQAGGFYAGGGTKNLSTLFGGGTS